MGIFKHKVIIVLSRWQTSKRPQEFAKEAKLPLPIGLYIRRCVPVPNQERRGRTDKGLFPYLSLPSRTNSTFLSHSFLVQKMVERRGLKLGFHVSYVRLFLIYSRYILVCVVCICYLYTLKIRLWVSDKTIETFTDAN